MIRALDPRLRLLVFALLAAGQLAVPGWKIAARELTLRHGEAFRFKTAPVDPYDAFRGRYVALGFESSAAPVPEGLELRPAQKVFVELERDAQGFARLAAVSLERPASRPYLRLRVAWLGDGEAHFTLPFDRYYLNERLAPEAERAYREHSRASRQDAYVDVRVQRGRAVVEELYVGGRPIVDFVLRPSG